MSLQPKKKFYITGVYHSEKFNDCTLPPLEVYGIDRIDALLSTGVTVWTEEEWIEAEKLNKVVSGMTFQEMCEQTRKEAGPVEPNGV